MKWASLVLLLSAAASAVDARSLSPAGRQQPPKNMRAARYRLLKALGLPSSTSIRPHEDRTCQEGGCLFGSHGQGNCFHCAPVENVCSRVRGMVNAQARLEERGVSIVAQVDTGFSLVDWRRERAFREPSESGAHVQLPWGKLVGIIPKLDNCLARRGSSGQMAERDFTITFATEIRTKKSQRTTDLSSLEIQWGPAFTLNADQAVNPLVANSFSQSAKLSFERWHEALAKQSRTFFLRTAKNEDHAMLYVQAEFSSPIAQYEAFKERDKPGLLSLLPQPRSQWAAGDDQQNFHFFRDDTPSWPAAVAKIYIRDRQGKDLTRYDSNWGDKEIKKEVRRKVQEVLGTLERNSCLVLSCRARKTLKPTLQLALQELAKQRKTIAKELYKLAGKEQAAILFPKLIAAALQDLIGTVKGLAVLQPHEAAVQEQAEILHGVTRVCKAGALSVLEAGLKQQQRASSDSDSAADAAAEAFGEDSYEDDSGDGFLHDLAGAF